MSEEEQIINQILEKQGPLSTVKEPVKKQKRPLSQKQKDHLDNIRKKGLETIQQNKLKRIEEKKLEKERVIKDKVEKEADEKVNKVYQEKINKLDDLSNKLQELLNKKSIIEPPAPKPKRQRKPNKPKVNLVEEPPGVQSVLPFRF